MTAKPRRHHREVAHNIVPSRLRTGMAMRGEHIASCALILACLWAIASARKEGQIYTTGTCETCGDPIRAASRPSMDLYKSHRCFLQAGDDLVRGAAALLPHISSSFPYNYETLPTHILRNGCYEQKIKRKD